MFILFISPSHLKCKGINMLKGCIKISPERKTHSGDMLFFRFAEEIAEIIIIQDTFTVADLVAHDGGNGVDVFFIYHNTLVGRLKPSVTGLVGATVGFPIVAQIKNQRQCI